MEKVDLRTTSYFSLPFLIIGGALDVFCLIALFEGVWLLGVVLWLVSLLIFTTHYRITVNFIDKTFHDYLWVLGWKVGEKGTFDSLEYVFIKRANVSQTVHSIVASTTLKKEVYDGYLKFSNGKTVHLLTKDSREALLAKLLVMAKKLQTTLVDYTQGEVKSD
jgi:hypothetical protein